MSLQTIKSISGQDEYVLLPINAYKFLKKQIDKVLKENYESFELSDYISNPVALARINAQITQEELAAYLKISQAYISKIENQTKVSAKLMEKILHALKAIKKFHAR